MVRQEVKDYVDNLIKSRPVVGFSKSYCPFCIKAKALIDYTIRDKSVLEWVQIENREDMNEIQDYLQELTGGRTVPRVFIGGKFFGGGDDVEKEYRTGELRKQLAEAGALNVNVDPKTKDYIDGLIKKYPVLSFSKSYCPFCIKGKAFLEYYAPKFKAGAYEWIEIETRPDYPEIQDYLFQLTGGRTVPRVFVGGKFIGGGDDLELLMRKKELEPLLKEVGAFA